MPCDAEIKEAMLMLGYKMDKAFSTCALDYRFRILELAVSIKRNRILEALQNDTDTLAQAAWK